MKPIIFTVTAAAMAASALALAQESRTTIAVQEAAPYGSYLVDAEGRPVYLLEGDPKGKSTCYGACAEVWPPVTNAFNPPVAAGPGVDESLLGTLPRRGGPVVQVTYNGHPLYYYVKDRGARRPIGHDVHDSWGEWYLVSPQGGKVEAHAKAAAAGRPALAGQFDKIDLDGDGTLSHYEFNTFMSR